MNTLQVKKIVKYHEDIENIRYGVKPYLKLKDINIMQTKYDNNGYLKSIVYDFSFNKESKYVHEITFYYHKTELEFIERIAFN